MFLEIPNWNAVVFAVHMKIRIPLSDLDVFVISLYKARVTLSNLGREWPFLIF